MTAAALGGTAVTAEVLIEQGTMLWMAGTSTLKRGKHSQRREQVDNITAYGGRVRQPW